VAANGIVTLTTDFGGSDHFVGTMRGVILGVNPAARVVDLCNSVNSFDVLDGALTIDIFRRTRFTWWWWIRGLGRLGDRCW